MLFLLVFKFIAEAKWYTTNGFAGIITAVYCDDIERMGTNVFRYHYPIVKLVGTINDGTWSLHAGCGNWNGVDACNAVCTSLGNLGIVDDWDVECGNGYPDKYSAVATYCIYKSGPLNHDSVTDDWYWGTVGQTQLCHNPMYYCDCISSSNHPSTSPTSPSCMPTSSPSSMPTSSPSYSPTISPTNQIPSRVPSIQPTWSPSQMPTTFSPSDLPSSLPTLSPTIRPTFYVTYDPTTIPSFSPTVTPTTNKDPSIQPTTSPREPSPKSSPSNLPSTSPTFGPTSSVFILPPDVMAATKADVITVSFSFELYQFLVGIICILIAVVVIMGCCLCKRKKRKINRDMNEGRTVVQLYEKPESPV